MAPPALHRWESPRRARRVGALLLLGCLFPGALGVAQERVDPVPEAPEPIVEALSPFSDDPDSSRVAALLADMAEHDFPASDYDGVLVARLWRRAGATELALKSLDAVLIDSDAVDLALYETARTFFESGRDAGGARAYWSACGSPDPRVRAEIAWDLLPVTVPDEREAWPDVRPGEPTCDWLRTMWGERAHQSAIPRDRRIALHYRRLAYARERYWIPRPRFLVGMADYHGRPPGLAIDDRGLIYIRMGEPAHKEACSGLDEGLLGECWAYERPAGYKIYTFAVHPERSDGDFRLTEELGPSQPGDMWFQKYVINADIPRTAKTRLVLRGGAAAGAAVRDADEAVMDRAEGAPAARAIELALRRFADEALERIPDAPNIRSTLTMRFTALRFLNPSSRRWQIWFLTSARAGDLSVSSEGEATKNVGGRFSTFDALNGVSIREFSSRSLPASSVAAEAGIGLRGVLEARPGPLRLTVVIEDLNAPGTGAWLQDTINVPAVGGLPQLSDIAIAQAEGGTWTRDGQTFLQVTPAHITNPDGSIHTYFEAYGVQPGTRYEVELRLTEADAAERIWRLEPDDLAFRLQFTSEMPGDIGRHHLRLDLSNTEPGEYVLAVRIQDDETKAYSLPSVTDVFVAER